MTLMDIKKTARHMWRTYGTLNNIVFAVAVVIAASWAWGSISMMQTNFTAQKSVDDQMREQKLVQLEVDTLKYQQNYYKSDEYKDLAARTNLGLASPGEKVLILPKNSPEVVAADDADAKHEVGVTPVVTRMSNFDQWINFLVGSNAKELRK